MAEYGRSHGLVALLIAVGCGNELVGADGTGDSSGSSSGLITTVTVSATSATSATTTTFSTSADTTNDTATTADTSATTAETSATTEGETGECPVGGAGCPCTGGGACDPGLVCNDDVCGNPECPIGSAGCPCTGGGACDPGLVCEDDACVDAPSTSEGSSSSPVTATDSASSESGIPPDCGDGNIDPGEDCDDGDQVQGNGCNNNCLASGAELWTVVYAGPDLGDDQARDIAVDANDDFVVTGTRTVAGEGRDIVTRKYDTDGGLVWERSYGSPDGAQDEAWGVAIDDTGDIVIVGNGYTAGMPTATVRKYDSDGQIEWTDIFVGAESSTGAFGVAIDQAGDVVVAGFEVVPGEGENLWVRKYDTDGAEIWSEVQDLGMGMNDVVYGVHTDAADNIIITGAAPGGAYAGGYDADFGLLWTQEPMNTVNLWGVGSASVDEIFIAGGSSLGQGRLQRLDEDGQLLWTQNYAPNGGSAGLLDVAIDSDGAIIVCGAESGGGNHRILTRKYGSNGSAYWTRTYAGVVNAIDPEEAWGVEVDSGDNVIVVGYESVDGQDDWWIRKYTP